MFGGGAVSSAGVVVASLARCSSSPTACLLVWSPSPDSPGSIASGSIARAMALVGGGGLGGPTPLTENPAEPGCAPVLRAGGLDNLV